MVIQEKLTCKSCGKNVRKDTLTGYCASCFHSNTDNIKKTYNALRWESGISKKHNWRFRGAIISDKEVKDFNSQSNCGICGIDFSLAKKCLDHCHETGVYRGALCVQCNTSLGKLGDDLDLVIARLQTYKKRR
jgi:Zn finger protein HypA/HybF involved in hydrogenase expression